MNPERDYLLGTHDEEIARLALQHHVWRPRVLDAWQRAGFNVGQTLLDIGCGPGHAAIDLAEIVGPAGRVVAVDQSRRFLDFLEATRRQRGLGQIETHELDLNEAALPQAAADGAWCRWVLAFVKRPRDLLERIAGALRPGGVLVLHEYFDYATWRMAPRCGPLEEFVQVVMASWRADGGEPDIGLELPGWLAELGFTVRSLHPIIEVIRPTHFMWQWPKSFIHGGLRRMVDLGRLTPEQAQAMDQAFVAAEAAPHTLMITPAVLEVVAVRS